jgi:hypothetical protein
MKYHMLWFPQVIKECEGLQRLLEHLADHTSTMYKDALSIMALGSVQVIATPTCRFHSC